MARPEAISDCRSCVRSRRLGVGLEIGEVPDAALLTLRVRTQIGDSVASAVEDAGRRVGAAIAQCGTPLQRFRTALEPN
jgi:hypothetical protein